MSMKSRMRKLKMVYPAQLRDKKQQGEVQIILLPWYDQDQIHQNSGAPETLCRFAGLSIKYSGDLK